MPTVNEIIERGDADFVETLFPLQNPLPPQNLVEQADRVEEIVRLALACSCPSRKVPERRVETRHAYPYPIYLTPLDKQGELLADETIVAIGKHLSDHGVDFYHRAAVPHRQMICSMTVGDRRWVSLLLQLSWCRFSSHGWYENGGKFLKPAPTPVHLVRR